MPLSATADRAIQAYGGRDRWTSAHAIEVTYSAWGWAFRAKFQRPLVEARAHVTIHEPQVRITPIDAAGHTGVLSGHDVHLETGDGRIVARRDNARAAFPSPRRLLWWDTLDNTYFSAYALWNYMTLPALLMREDVAWTEVADGCLEGRFPSSIPTHNEVQRFHFGPDGLLRQHDYTPDVVATFAPVAHVVLEHARWQDVPYTSKRRVTPRRGDGTPRSAPLLVGIEVHEWRLV